MTVQRRRGGRPTTARFIDHSTHEVVEVTLPPCPTCGATATRCLRPSGHEASSWHVAREVALAPLIGWPDFRPGDVCTDQACKDAAAAAGL